MASENTVASVVRSESRPLTKAKDQEWITVTKLDPGVWDMKIKFFEVICSLCRTCLLRCSMRTFLKMYGLKIMFALSAVELASRPESSQTQVWVSLFQRSLCCHPSGYHYGQVSIASVKRDYGKVRLQTLSSSISSGRPMCCCTSVPHPQAKRHRHHLLPVS